MSRNTTKLFDECVDSEWDEGRYADGGDGYWMTLKHGWTLDDTSCVHEDTRKQCLARLSECQYKTPYWKANLEDKLWEGAPEAHSPHTASPVARFDTKKVSE